MGEGWWRQSTDHPGWHLAWSYLIHTWSYPNGLDLGCWSLPVARVGLEALWTLTWRHGLRIYLVLDLTVIGLALSSQA